MQIFIKNKTFDDETENLFPILEIKGIEVANGVDDPVCNLFATIMSHVKVGGTAEIWIENGQDRETFTVRSAICINDDKKTKYLRDPIGGYVGALIETWEKEVKPLLFELREEKMEQNFLDVAHDISEVEEQFSKALNAMLNRARKGVSE